MLRRALAVTGLVTVVVATIGGRAAAGGQTRPAALPSVLPPTPLGGMTWTHGQPPFAGGAFAGGQAVLGVAGGIDGAELAHTLGLRVTERLPGLRAVQVSASAAKLAALARARDPRLRYVEPVIRGSVAHVRNDPLTWEVDPATGAPWEWQFSAVGVDAALSAARGDPGIVVGVVDSGVSPVPDLSGKIAGTYWDKTLHPSAADVIGHGTFVSSIIAARNDDGFGLAGFCGACRIAVFKAAPVTDVQVAEGIRTLTDAHVRVINLSIVLNAPSQAVTDALGYAAAAGVLVVAAGGNEGGSSLDFPASAVGGANGAAAPGLAVGASDRTGRRASFSNSGPELSLLAPGAFDASCSRGIFGALPPVATDFEAGASCSVIVTRRGGARYAYAGGTSFAAPEVAGVAALVWSLKPSLTSVQVASILEQTATRPAGSGWTPATGWGVLDAKAAVESVTGKTITDALVLSDLRVSRPRGPGDRVRATVQAGWNDGTAVVAGAKVACSITVEGRRLGASAHLGGGSARCSFTLPHGSGGAAVVGAVSLTAPGATGASASFRFRVP